MLSLRSISNITERVADAGGSRVIQTGRAARNTSTSKAIARNAASPAIREVASPRRCCRQTANASAAPSGNAKQPPVWEFEDDRGAHFSESFWKYFWMRPR